ncbi:MAG: caa(3)-type oxidase, subunit [Schlesneria sp.]|nr:caa(3)-type oxidase, subunit [Schlesneria sp.]
MSDHAHDATHDHEYHSHGKLYFSIFLALCAFTLISIMADLIHIPNRALLVGVVLSVAVCKALCVLLIFMHLKFERTWKYLLLAPTFILAATIPFALTPDIGTHYYVPTAPQIREYEAQEAAKAAGGDSHGHGDSHDAGHKAEAEKHH